VLSTGATINRRLKLSLCFGGRPVVNKLHLRFAVALGFLIGKRQAFTVVSFVCRGLHG
jgi:hypothetical protein